LSREDTVKKEAKAAKALVVPVDRAEIEIDVPVWYTKIWLYRGMTAKEAARLATKVLKLRCVPPTNSYASVWCARDWSHTAVWFDGRPSPGVIAHECIHIMNHVFSEKGMPNIVSDNEEAWAYFMEYLVSTLGGHYGYPVS
jgi:hypothetical protein